MGATFMPQAGLVAPARAASISRRRMKVAATGLVSAARDGDKLLGTIERRHVPRHRHADRPRLRSHRHPPPRPAGSRLAARHRRLRGTGRAESARARQSDRPDAGATTSCGATSRAGPTTITWCGATPSSRRQARLVWGDSEHTDSNHLVWGDAVAGRRSVDATVSNPRADALARAARLRLCRSRRWAFRSAVYCAFTLAARRRAARVLIFAALTLAERPVHAEGAVGRGALLGRRRCSRSRPCCCSVRKRARSRWRSTALLHRLAAAAHTHANALQLRQPRAVGLDLRHAVLPGRRACAAASCRRPPYGGLLLPLGCSGGDATSSSTAA